MKKLLIVALLAIGLTACNDHDDRRWWNRTPSTNTTIINQTVVNNPTAAPTPKGVVQPTKVGTINTQGAGVVMAAKPLTAAPAGAKVYDVKTNTTTVVAPKTQPVIQQQAAVKNTPSMSSYSAPKSTTTWSSSRSTPSFSSSSFRSGRK